MVRDENFYLAVAYNNRTHVRLHGGLGSEQLLARPGLNVKTTKMIQRKGRDGRGFDDPAQRVAILFVFPCREISA